MTKNYDPETHWDKIGKKSKSGLGQKAKFGTNQTGKSQYDIPSFDAQPKFIDYIKIGSKVLDIGSGIGFEISKSFAERNCQVVINGRNEKKLKNASKKIEGALTVAGNGQWVSCQ